MVLLVGLGLLLSFLFQTFGLDLIPARMLGFAAAGLLVAIAGTLLVLKAVKVFSKLSFAPSRTLSTIPNLPEHPSASRARAKAARARPARELEHDVLETEKRVAVALQDLARRLSPTYYINAGVQRVCSHPLRWSLIALLTGVASSVWFVRRLQRPNS